MHVDSPCVLFFGSIHSPFLHLVLVLTTNLHLLMVDAQSELEVDFHQLVVLVVLFQCPLHSLYVCNQLHLW